MPDFAHRHHKDSFVSALRGLALALKTQPNFKIMLAAAVAVFALGFFFHVSKVEWLILAITTVIVFICEMINTSIEAVVDLVTEEWRENARVAKDVAGGMVLLSVFMSVVIGLMIFLPKFI